MLLSITSRGRTVLVSVAILLVVAVLVPGPAFDAITHNQELTVAIVTPQYPTAATTRPEVMADVYSTSVNVGNVSSQILQSLRDAGMTGNYQVADLCRQGHGKQVLVIIVVNQPIVSQVELHVPSGANVIYVQQPDGWKKTP